MLRLTMDWFARAGLSANNHPLAVPAGCRWFSTAQLPSIFKAVKRGDGRGERQTEADGVIGDFQIASDGKGYLTLTPESSHFVVLEAKMFSSLSSGTKNAAQYNQAARTVACMAETLKRAALPATMTKTLGLYVLAPASQIKKGVFATHLTKISLQGAVEKRAAAHGEELDLWLKDELALWLKDWFHPTLAHIAVGTISWEDLIAFVTDHDSYGTQLGDFYGQCLHFNRQQ